jgi:hypothetical protein
MKAETASVDLPATSLSAPGKPAGHRISTLVGAVGMLSMAFL